MSAKKTEPARTALQASEQLRLEAALRENLSPEVIAAIIAFLQPDSNYPGKGEEGQRAMRELEWFKDMLLDMIGVQEFNRMMDEIGL